VDIVTIPFGMSPPMSTHSASQRGHSYLGRRGHLNLGATCKVADGEHYVNYA
jgi:hypothetical protein